jgi:hypothetical protein
MPQVTIKRDANYDKSLSSTPTTLPTLGESVYRLKVTEARLNPTKEGRPRISLNLQVKYDMVADEDRKGSVRFQDVMITSDESGFVLKQLCEATGLEAPDQDVDAINEFCEALLGVELHGHVKPKKNQNGDSYPSVRAYLTEDAAHDLAANFR